MTVAGDAVLGAIRGMLESVELVPVPFEAYRPLVVDGLVYFLGRLSPERLEAVAAEQLALAASGTDPDDRLAALLRRSPTLHKLGQVMAHERGLPANLRERLQRLESLPPAEDVSAVLATIRAAIGDRPDVALADRALAEGSVATVVAFELAVPGEAATRPGVFKVLTPGARERLIEDLATWDDLAAYLEERGNAYELPVFDYRGFLGGVGALLRDEVRLDREQANLARAAAIYAKTPGVVVPALFGFSTPDVTAMERIDAVKATETALSPAARRKLAETAVEALLARPFWTSFGPALFHADPHAGNLMATADGKLVVLDWALTTELGQEQLGAVVQTLLGALTLDEGRTAAAIAGLGRVTNDAALRAVVAEGIRSVRLGTFPGFAWLTGLLDGLARTGAIDFPQAAVLFRKSLLTLAGVIADISEDVSIDAIVLASGAGQFFRESPQRPFAPVESRDFGTHLSTGDLARAWATLPWLPSRFWLGTWSDILRAGLPSGPIGLT